MKLWVSLLILVVLLGGCASTQPTATSRTQESDQTPSASSQSTLPPLPATQSSSSALVLNATCESYVHSIPLPSSLVAAKLPAGYTPADFGGLAIVTWTVLDCRPTQAGVIGFAAAQIQPKTDWNQSRFAYYCFELDAQMANVRLPQSGCNVINGTYNFGSAPTGIGFTAGNLAYTSTITPAESTGKSHDADMSRLVSGQGFSNWLDYTRNETCLTYAPQPPAVALQTTGGSLGDFATILAGQWTNCTGQYQLALRK